MKNLLYSTLVICTFMFSSCGGGGCDTDSITAATNKINDALTAYSMDASTENCNAYKAAIDDYISELDDCDLVPQSTIDSFQSQRDDLTC